MSDLTLTTNSDPSLTTQEVFNLINPVVQTAGEQKKIATTLHSVAIVTTDPESENAPTVIAGPDRYISGSVSQPAVGFRDGHLGIYSRVWTAEIEVATAEKRCTAAYRIETLSIFDSEEREIRMTEPLTNGSSTVITKTGEACIELKIPEITPQK